MYKVENKSEYFYKQNLLKGNVLGPFDREEFLQRIYNELTDGLNKWNYSGSDSGYWVDFSNYEFKFYETRPILYFDGEGRILDPRNFIKEAIQKSYGNEKIKNPDIYWDSRLYSSYSWKRNHSYEFRYDPVPGTGGYKYRYRHHTNRGKKGLKRTFVQATDPEYKKYIRKKSIPFSNFESYDLDGDVWHNYDSWKNHKVRKQWMKNL